MRDDKEELYRRLAQTQRMLGEAFDPLTMERLNALAEDIEAQLAAAEAADTDAPPE